MRIYLQWSKRQAEDWQPVEVTSSTVIRRLARKPVPNPSSPLDDQPGWVTGINCQGIDFTGYDHYAVEVLGGDRLCITAWNDDPEDWGDSRLAVQWILSPPAPDPALGGRVNTVQQRKVWCTDDLGRDGSLGDTLPWATFTQPPSGVTLHGVWLPEVLFDEHLNVRSVHGWREWT